MISLTMVSVWKVYTKCSENDNVYVYDEESLFCFSLLQQSFKIVSGIAGVKKRQ